MSCLAFADRFTLSSPAWQKVAGPDWLNVVVVVCHCLLLLLLLLWSSSSSSLLSLFVVCSGVDCHCFQPDFFFFSFRADHAELCNLIYHVLVCFPLVQDLEKTCNPIVNKPKPKVEPPKAEPKAEGEAAPQADAQQQPAPEADPAAAQPQQGPVDIDVD